MSRWALLLLLALLLVGAAYATNPTSPNYVPTYSARYQEDGLQREILAELKAIRAELSAIRKQSAREPQAETLVQAITGRCAACHSEDVAEKKGGGFVWLLKSGKVPPLSLGEKKLIDRAIESGKMPPPAGLTSDERQRFHELLYPREEP